MSNFSKCMPPAVEFARTEDEKIFGKVSEILMEKLSGSCSWILLLIREFLKTPFVSTLGALSSYSEVIVHLYSDSVRAF